MVTEIDCRGLDCSGPLIKAKALIEKDRPDHIRIIVDNDAAVENVSRFLDHRNYEVGVDSDGMTTSVVGIRTSESPDKIGPLPTDPMADNILRSPGKKDVQKILVFIGSQEIGKGEPDLGKKLMMNYIRALKEMGPELWRLIFVNHGVKFVINGSEVLSDLKGLEAEGTRVLVCGTCLTYLGLTDARAVGQTTNMPDIITAMQLADKIISL